MVQTDSILLL